MFDRYWNAPEPTAKTIRPDPTWQSGGPAPLVVYTGDLGYLDDTGLIYVLDRKDRMIKTMGFKVSPIAVEQVLRANPDVDDAAVFALPHDILGHELRAAIVMPTESPDRNQKFRSYVRDSLSPEMRPQKFLFLPQLPRTPSGKTDYKALVDLAAQTAAPTMKPAIAAE